MSKFNTVATIHAPRSRHDLSYSVKTSGSVGTLYPCYIQEIYPGDTFNCDTSFVARLSSSFIRPVMDNLFIDFYYFFVPSRLCYDRWEEIFGENRNGAWAQVEEVVAPTNKAVMTCYSGTVPDYLGMPPGQIPKGVNMIPFRAFARIYDEWFRDENIQDPMFIDKGEWDLSQTFNSGDWSPNNYLGKCPKVSKFHDVFTSCLPNTQKSYSPVYVPLGSFVPLSVTNTLSALGGTPKISGDNLGVNGGAIGYGPGTVASSRDVVTSDKTFDASGDVLGTNLGIDLGDANVLTVPDLRYAFQLQRILERSARTGTRYTEYILGAFNVQSPDARLQRSEYLGGKRQPLTVQQVASTVRGNDAVDELGTLGAFSLSNGKCGYQKGFVEHGYVIGVYCIRQHHTYQQGIERFWQRSDRFSYYDPALCHISEQPVYKSELFAKGYDELQEVIFGYQEAWYDLRNRVNHITGQMRSDAENSLDIWHFGDDYSSPPALVPSFIKETPDFVDRTIAVPSTSLDQFILDIYHHQSAVRRISVESIPGLIDHY